MRNYLLGRGLWEFTQGTAKAPETESKQELEAFTRQFYQTNSILVGSCSREIVLGLEWSMDPRATWTHLEKQYQPLGKLQRLEAYMDFRNLRYDGKDLTTFCQEYQGKLQRCRQLGITQDEDLVIYPFIQEITPYFEAYAVCLRTRTPDGGPPVHGMHGPKVPTAARAGVKHSRERRGGIRGPQEGPGDGKTVGRVWLAARIQGSRDAPTPRRLRRAGEGGEARRRGGGDGGVGRPGIG